MDLDALVARPIADLLPVADARAALRVLIASLAPGGAERIVLEWLAAERSRGRDVELAILHPRRHALAVPQGIARRIRARESVEAFIASLARDWRAHPAPVSTHLVADDVLAMLWAGGVRTVPTIHNAPQGWRNDASAWREANVPLVIACADSVRASLASSGCRIPIVTLRHRPRVGAAAFDAGHRAAMRAHLGIGEKTFLVGAIGAIKPQKDYARAVEVLAELARRRDCALAIVGGVLDASGLGEIDRLLGRAVALGVGARLRLPGFLAPIEPALAALDAVVNVSRYEGLSIAAQEALAAGLPVVATAVGGQGEIDHPSLCLVPGSATAGEIAAKLASAPIRNALEGRPFERAPRAWSVATFARAKTQDRLETIFVTANLNAGGAQRSLVNLACALRARHRLAVAVCGDTTSAWFAQRLRASSIETFRAAPSSDPIAIAESLLAHAGHRGARSLCFWNADSRVKLLVAKFAPPGLRLVDASPGDDAFAEMEAASRFGEAVATSPQAYYERLDLLVLKHRAEDHPRCRRTAFIPNGVEPMAHAPLAQLPHFLVSGRIAPSKRLEDILAAFGRVRGVEAHAQLHIFGTVEPRHREYAATLWLTAPGVTLRGASFDHGHLREPWRAAVVIGTNQGSPNAVLEAMAAGIPVIANDSGGTRDCVIGGETGWLLGERAPVDEIAAAMLQAARAPELAAMLGVRAREFVRARHCLEEMAARYLAALVAEMVPAHEKMTAWTPPLESPPICVLQASSR